MDERTPNHIPAGVSPFRIVILFTLIVATTLSSCTPATALPATPTVQAQPTLTRSPTATLEPTSTVSAGSMLQAGVVYPDSPEDMAVSYLDVVSFQATVDEAAETLKVVFHMRDIPSTAPKRQILNFVEYWWEVGVFLDPSNASAPDAAPDYDLSLFTVSGYGSADQGVQTPQSGTTTAVPFNQLWDEKNLYNNAGETVGTLDATGDPDQDTLTLTANIPGITSQAVFNYSTFYYDGTLDRPDNYVPPDQSSAAASTTELPPGSTPEVYDTDRQLIPAGPVRAYPGPEHYAGDILTFEIQLEGDFNETSNSVMMALDNQAPTAVPAKLLFGNKVVLPLALDTSGLSGTHQVSFSTPGGSVNAAYTLVLLPASQLPENERNASWKEKEIGCCILHTIAGTAAARDVDYIADHLNKAAADFQAITGKVINPKLQIYFIDRMWGNGGYGGTGALVISYTDRYYGPMVGAVGLETTARHEFTHAAGVGLDLKGDGVAFNTEGLAVYVAGGHYKPEPLDKRGGALYDLGYYVPVGENIAQHEVSYLYSAAMLTYIADEYGKAKLWEFLATDVDPNDGQPTPLETAMPVVFGISLQQFDQDFRAWLESQDPGDQLDDLRLTVALQDLRRQYQDTYTPPPFFIYDAATVYVMKPEYLPVMIREAHEAPNIAAELIIADAQKAIVAGDYPYAETLIHTIGDVVATGQFNDPLAQDYLEIVLAVKQQGYEVEGLEIQGNQATARVSTAGSTIFSSLQLQKSSGTWQVKP